MVTLYKRATPAQKLVLRMVEGAVKNAKHFHPEWGLPDYAARSIAKRAAGTLTAQWPEVLAASLSDRVGTDTLASTQPLPEQTHHRAKRGASHSRRRPPLFYIQREISMMAGEARRAGNQERLNTLADVLRIIAKITTKKK